MLGTDFPYQQFYPKEAKIIQVDLRGEQIGRRTPVDLGLIGKVNDTLEALVTQVGFHCAVPNHGRVVCKDCGATV